MYVMYVCMYVCMYIYLSIYLSIYLALSLSLYIYIYIYTHLHIIINLEPRQIQINVFVPSKIKNSDLDSDTHVYNQDGTLLFETIFNFGNHNWNNGSIPLPK